MSQVARGKQVTRWSVRFRAAKPKRKEIQRQENALDNGSTRTQGTERERKKMCVVIKPARGLWRRCGLFFSLFVSQSLMEKKERRALLLVRHTNGREKGPRMGFPLLLRVGESRDKRRDGPVMGRR